jgi:hypothetical protein
VILHDHESDLRCPPFSLLVLSGLTTTRLVYLTLKGGNVPCGSFLQLFEPLGSGEEREWNVQGNLRIELRVEEEHLGIVAWLLRVSLIRFRMSVRAY